MDCKQLNIKLNNYRNELQTVQDQICSLRKRAKTLSEEIVLIESSLQQSLSNEGNDCSVKRFNTTDFYWSAEAQSLLNDVFKLENFRSFQLSTINATMSGYDVLLIMPTGGGLTLIISPMISLMEDQFDQLKTLGIAAKIFNSTTSKEEAKDIIQSLGNNGSLSFNLLYVTPEKLAKSKTLLSQLDKCYRNKNFKRIVIDEVHCCSHWGHDFRIDYQFLGVMRTQFPETPILGLTATATPQVISDCQKILNIQGCFVFKDSFFRPNLKYFIERIESKTDLIDTIAKKLKNRYLNKSGLIYCLTIKDVEEVAERLSSQGISAAPYHASLTAERRNRIYQRWMQDKLQVIVATIAFGMGINKKDVRFVLHYSMSKSFENYYQETGRAGRDGEPADCILYFHFNDIFRASTLVFGERNGLSNLYAMVSYCINRSVCRKEQIANYFGDDWKNQCDSCCDNCLRAKNSIKTINIINVMESLSLILTHATQLNRRLTSLKLVEIWLGKGEKKLRPNNLKTPEFHRELAEEIIAFLLINSYLQEEFHFTPYSTISYVQIGPKWLMRLNTSRIDDESAKRIDFLYIENNSISKQNEF
ncbi:ATP-dependent DNA helicase Q1-like protein [Sarcoptes scabiei]|uniref:ATP-dependent DNA helicase n=1 Tax=Sarcoptes scabiei TaxID=52283 RepID=A0A132AFH7_SARSC|nr:ATP-dependent DNA helicase Q1-like protein [Sarcoptes scabiei]